MTPGQRNYYPLNRKELLLFSRIKAKSKKNYSYKGRNGKITTWHLGGGHKQLYRQLDNTLGVVEGLEYDPNRTSWISRVFHPDLFSHNYQLATTKVQRGTFIGNKVQRGHRIPLNNMPLGSLVSNVENRYIRGAGTYGQLVQKTEINARIKLPSGEHKIFPLKALATLGRLCGEDQKLTKLGKAGRNRWLGRRPIVRGVAMNPVDHPHGGGEGKTSGGRPSVTPWGKPTKK
jgi:large subunit ribosomal protein L2